MKQSQYPLNVKVTVTVTDAEGDTLTTVLRKDRIGQLATRRDHDRRVRLLATEAADAVLKSY